MPPDGGPVHSQDAQNQADRPEFGKHVEYTHDGLPGDDPGGLATQAGVKRIEAVSKAWTKTSLVIAYVSCVSPLLLSSVITLMPHPAFFLSPTPLLSRSRSRAPCCHSQPVPFLRIR